MIKKTPLIVLLFVISCLGCNRKKEQAQGADRFKEDLKTICWIMRDDREVQEAIRIAPPDRRGDFWADAVNLRLKSVKGKALFEEMAERPEAGRCAPLHAAIEEAGLQEMGCPLVCPFSERYTVAALKGVRLPVVDLSPDLPERFEFIPLGDDTIAITLKGEALRLSGRLDATPQEVIAASKGKKVHLITDASTTVEQLDQVSASLMSAGAEALLLIARRDNQEQRRGASVGSMPMMVDGGDVHIPFRRGGDARGGPVVQVILSGEGVVVQFSREGRAWRLPSTCANAGLTLCASSPSEPAASSLYNILFAVRRAMAWGDDARLELYTTPTLSAHHLIGWMELMRFVLADYQTDKDQAVLIDADASHPRYMPKGDLWAPVFMGITSPPLAEAAEAIEAREIKGVDFKLRPQHRAYFSTFIADRSPRIASCYSANATVQERWVMVMRGEALWNVCAEGPHNSVSWCAYKQQQAARPNGGVEIATLAQCLREALAPDQTLSGRDEGVIASEDTILLPLLTATPSPAASE
jgi:hypothetical protein